MGSAREDVLLHAEMPMYPKNKPTYSVTLTQCAVTFVPVNGTTKKTSHAIQTIRLEDIVGCDCMKGRQEDDMRSYLTIYAYPHVRKFGSKKTVRHRQPFTLVFQTHSTYDENCAEATKWKSHILCLIRDIDITQDIKTMQLPEPKRLLFLVNPFSGSGNGKATLLFEQRVVPILAEAAMPYHMIVTEYAGHAREMMHTLDLTEWRGIVIVSGDGLVYEVFNGLMERRDWDKAIQMPIGCLPGGSGNALASALAHSVGEPYMDNQILHSSFIVAKHQPIAMDLVAIDTCDGQRMYSFLAVAWGLVSDVDIQSEKLRSMGDARFTFGAIAKIMSLKKYRGRVSFLPAEAYSPPKQKKSAAGKRRSKSVSVTSTPSESPTLARSKSMGDGTEAGDGGAIQPLPVSADNQAGLQKVSTDNIDTQHDSVAHADGKSTTEDVDTAANSGEDIQRLQRGADVQSLGSEVPTPLLVPLDQPVPKNWVTLEGEFISVTAVYITHLAKDTIAAPESKLDDGVIYLNLTKGSASRMKMLQILTSMQDGSYHGDSDSEIVKVKAFRIEPVTESGIVTVDGEVVKYGPIQGQVLPSFANVMNLKKKMGANEI